MDHYSEGESDSLPLNSGEGLGMGVKKVEFQASSSSVSA
jgi:hypothetical protein